MNLVLEVEPTNASALYWKGRVNMAKGTLGEALSDLEKAIQSEPENPTIENCIRQVREKLRKISSVASIPAGDSSTRLGNRGSYDSLSDNQDEFYDSDDDVEEFVSLSAK